MQGMPSPASNGSHPWITGLSCLNALNLKPVTCRWCCFFSPPLYSSWLAQNFNQVLFTKQLFQKMLVQFFLPEFLLIRFYCGSEPAMKSTVDRSGWLPYRSSRRMGSRTLMLKFGSTVPEQKNQRKNPTKYQKRCGEGHDCLGFHVINRKPINFCALESECQIVGIKWDLSGFSTFWWVQVIEG